MADLADWRIAEYRAAEILVLLGFADARVTAATRDGGIDVVSARAVAQVKLWRSQVPARPVEELAALSGSRLPIFFAISFKQGVIERGDQLGVAIFEIGYSGLRVIPRNKTALQLFNSRPRLDQVQMLHELADPRLQSPGTSAMRPVLASTCCMVGAPFVLGWALIRKWSQWPGHRDVGLTITLAVSIVMTAFIVRGLVGMAVVEPTTASMSAAEVAAINHAASVPANSAAALVVAVGLLAWFFAARRVPKGPAKDDTGR